MIHSYPFFRDLLFMLSFNFVRLIVYGERGIELKCKNCILMVLNGCMLKRNFIKETLGCEFGKWTICGYGEKLEQTFFWRLVKEVTRIFLKYAKILRKFK